MWTTDVRKAIRRIERNGGMDGSRGQEGCREKLWVVVAVIVRGNTMDEALW